MAKFSYISEALSGVQRTSRLTDIAATCPFCGKDKEHFRLNVENGLWRCFKCDERGNAFTLLRHLGRLDLFFGSEEAVTYSEKVLVDFKLEPSTEELQLPKTVDLPVGSRRVFSNAYLEGRGFTSQDFAEVEVYKTKLVDRLAKYVILPIRMAGQVKGYIARAEYSKEEITNLKSKGIEFERYLNGPTGIDFRELLDGYDDIVQGETSTVILVEGKFDRLATTKKLGLLSSSSVRCCSLSGKSVGDNVIGLLRGLGVKNIILMLDRDALKELLSYSMNLFYNFTTKVALLKGKDPDESSSEELIEILSNLKDPLKLNTTTVSIKIK